MSTMANEQTTTRWTVVPEGTSVEFAVETFWGLATVHGRFERFAGSYETGPEGRTIELTIDADSLDTGNKTRDRHLRSSSFFRVAEHPQLRFVSTRVHDVGDGILHVVGRFEAAGRSLLLEFPAIVRSTVDGLEIEATTTIDQQRLEMSSGQLGMIRQPATVHVRARLSETIRARRGAGGMISGSVDASTPLDDDAAAATRFGSGPCSATTTRLGGERSSTVPRPPTTRRPRRSGAPASSRR